MRRFHCKYTSRTEKTVTETQNVTYDTNLPYLYNIYMFKIADIFKFLTDILVYMKLKQKHLWLRILKQYAVFRIKMSRTCT